MIHRRMSLGTQLRTAKILLVLLLTLLGRSVASSHVSEVLLTQATLFGGLDKDCTPNATTVCEPNVVDAVAWSRHLTASNVSHVFLPTLDRGHVLTKLHPKDWAANLYLHKQLGAAAGLLSTTGFTTVATLGKYSIKRDEPPLLDDFDCPVGDNLCASLVSRIVDAPTGLHVVMARRRLQSLEALAAQTAVTMRNSDTFRVQQGGYKNTVAMVVGFTARDFLEALESARARPAIVCSLYASSTGVEFKNGTWLVNVKTSKTHLHRIQIHRRSSTSSTIVNVTLTAQPLELPAANRTDAQYVADRAMMKAEALIAAANNPVQGSTAGPMPPPTALDGAALCRRGECAMGNLWADAIRNATGTDIALFAGGAWMKGPGWATGNVTLRDIYNAYDFIEMCGRVTVLGLSLFEMWNHSLAAAVMDPYMPTSVHSIPQVSGLRVKYNLARADINDRLISIEVWVKEQEEYRPLERLKRYSVSGMQYLLLNSPIHSDYLKVRYPGEVPMVPVNQEVQALVAAALVQTNGQYVPGIYGRIIEDNTSTVSMADWNHAVGCPPDFVLDVSINTCVACPPGTHRTVGEAACAPRTTTSKTALLVAVIAGVSFIAVVACAAAFYAVLQWRRRRRLRYCPRDPSVPIAAFFVTVRNEVAVRERYAAEADEAFRQIDVIVSDAADHHKCFVARRLGAHFLVVGTDVAAAAMALAQVQSMIQGVPWRQFLSATRTIVKGQKNPAWPVAASASPLSPVPTAVTPVGAGVLISVAPAPSSLSSPSDAAATPQTATEHSDNSVLRTVNTDINPQVSAGLAVGRAVIHHDDVLDTWAYAGPVVDAAATVADAARSGQFLATQHVVDAVVGVASVTSSVDFTYFTQRRMMCPVDHAQKTIGLSQVDCVGCQHRAFEDEASGDSDTAGVLTAALEVAAGGLTTRTVGAVCWSIPALRSPKAFASRAEQAKQLELVLAALTEVCKSFQADLTCAMDGTFVGVVNGASARTAQVATTSTALARAGVTSLQGVSKLSVVAGLATGPAMTGTLNNTVVVAGVAVERARLLAAVGFACAEGAPPVTFPDIVTVVVPASIVNELEPHYVLAVVDAIVWPNHCGQSSQGAAPHDLFCVFAVLGEKVLDQDEWLYQLEAASTSNPYSASNSCISEIIGGRRPAEEGAVMRHPAEPTEAYPAFNMTSLMAPLRESSATSSGSIPSVLQERLRGVCCSFASSGGDHECASVAWSS